MKILIINDDSINAPGIAVLARAAAQLGEVWVAAPAEQCSALSQKLTLRELIPVEEEKDFPVCVRSAWRIGGTPVDCVKVALEYLMEEKPAGAVGHQQWLQCRTGHCLFRHLGCGL
jgi:5'-nucleotidase